MTAVDTDPAPKPKRHRRRKYPATPLAPDIPDFALPPSLQALTGRRRKFCLEMYAGPIGYGSLIRACRVRGDDNALRVTASRVMADPQVQLGLRELGAPMLRGFAISAIRRLETIADDLQHKDCLRVAM